MVIPEPPPEPRLGWRIAREDQVRALEAQLDALTERVKSWTQAHANQSRKRWETHAEAHQAIETALHALDARLRRLGE